VGVSTQIISQAAQQAVNQSLARSVATANATLTAQQAITNGTSNLVKAAMADNSTIALTETRVTFHENPATVHTGPFSVGQVSVSPPQEGNTPTIDNVLVPTFSGLPNSETPSRLEPGASVQAPHVQGDLVVPGGMVKLEDVRVGAVTVETSPRAPEFTAPVFSTSPSDNPSRPGLDAAAQEYVQVVLVGSAQSVVNSAAPEQPPTGP
jgi:hypothetical protein